MNLFGARFPEKLDDPSACGAPDNGIIDQHHPFIPHAFFDSAQLDSHLIEPGALPGGDKGPADIFVLHQPYPVRNTGFPAESKGGVQPRIRHPTTTSARTRAACTDTPSMTESGLAK